MLTTVLIPVRNEERFIGACLESIRKAAALSRLEFIVIDDHSTDATAQVVRDFQRAHGDLDLILLENPGRGKSAALNFGFEHARGDIFILLAGDDLIVPEAVSDRIEAAARPVDQPVVATCRYRTLSEHPEFDGLLLPRPGQAHHIAGGATSFNRVFAERYFPIPETLPNEDTWLRAVVMLFGVQHRRLENVGLRYRVHQGNSMGMTYDFSSNSRLISARAKAYEIAMQRPDGPAEGRARLAPMVALERLRQAGAWYKIPFLRGVDNGDKLVALANSAAWIYAIKQRLSRLLSSKDRS